jgi:hypothetical protein
MRINYSGYQSTSGSLDKALVITKSGILVFLRKVWNLTSFYTSMKMSNGFIPQEEKWSSNSDTQLGSQEHMFPVKQMMFPILNNLK